jgi:hypothetical protein
VYGYAARLAGSFTGPRRAGSIEWFERGYAERDHQMVFLKVDLRLGAPRDRRDFGRLLERM